MNRGSAIQPSRVAARVERTENDRGGAIESPRFREIEHQQAAEADDVGDALPASSVP